MANDIDNREMVEPVANCDQLQNKKSAVATPIESRIMTIRGSQVMIDRDLAELYEVETRALNQAVNRNIDRFPEDFRFQLTKEECSKSQIVILNAGRGQNIKKLPYAFTEQIKTLAAQGLSEKEVLHRLAMTYDEQTVTDAMRKLIDLHGKL